jgi:threonine/homoserine/homoserine lactone efflux protein
MPPTDRLLAFTLAALVLIVIPGPSVLFVVSRALAYGRRVALATVAGGAVGSSTLAVAVAIGVGAVVQASAFAYTAVKLAGTAYLIFLGVQAFRHRKALAAALETGPERVNRRPWLQGFVVGVTNPKTAVFFAAVLPQFVDPGAGSAGLQMVVLGLIFAGIALASDAVWGAVAGAARSWFARSRRRMELIGGAAGLTMVGLGIGLAVEGPKPA